MCGGCVVNDGKKSENRCMSSQQWQSVVSDTFFPLDTNFISRQNFKASWILGALGSLTCRKCGVTEFFTNVTRDTF